MPFQTECPDCESTNLHVMPDGGYCHCRDCGKEADCETCFDTRTVWSDLVGMPATCPDCADMDVEVYRQYLRQYPLV